MIVIIKRKAARALYWAVLAYFALSTIGRVVADTIPDRLSVIQSALPPVVEGALASVHTYIYLAIAAALAGYFWPQERGYPTFDSITRAILLGLVLGVVFIGLANYIHVDMDFWSGFKFGFLAAAIIEPPPDGPVKT